jgi:hypothetical protein
MLFLPRTINKHTTMFRHRSQSLHLRLSYFFHQTSHKELISVQTKFAKSKHELVDGATSVVQRQLEKQLQQSQEREKSLERVREPNFALLVWL